MHLNDYKDGDIVELTKDVCENKKGDRGVVYSLTGQKGKAICLDDGNCLITGHIKLITLVIMPASDEKQQEEFRAKIKRNELLYGEAYYKVDPNNRHVITEVIDNESMVISYRKPNTKET